ncbi:hypothetical protein STSP2_03075 [Anaerohalosphaera lusitana]|uniref:DUF5107 domain-containing protein n=1 Tax=Anaerohalosphaera lusitana TaxID=1936003 RepID=A0A1U9NPX5_9BACT|nr:DUF5107 domain-containing protein [Anaerohalosphaera lusitana]AQT69875.1 hypothetical protein STSP2_03075 [Anaerohalosphaera lusitana]
MTSLRISQIELPSAGLGPENPLPPLRPLGLSQHELKVADSVPARNRKYLNYGSDAGCLPYRFQDSYNRIKRPKQFTAIILENDLLTATFLPTLGGRLYSLHHKPTNRQLLHKNPVFQPANLAMRNAWFSGGVEWNMSIPGHSPFTCEPVFAARLQTDDGTPVLRMYEFERIRKVPWQIDCFLPEGSPLLFVRVRLINSNDHEIPMYWWSNIAVDQASDTRVLAPANEAFTLGVEFEMKMVPFPMIEGRDMSYSRNVKYASDYFYRMPDMQMPWIAALDRNGRGMFQASTPRLNARKTFYWGNQPGGRKWQRFLSTPPNEYLEIQAGIAPTQAECIPMPARADWSWLEAYGPLEAGPEIIHGLWNQAIQHTQDQIQQTLSPAALEKLHHDTETLANTPPQEILHHGSGWARLENLLNESQNTASPFPASQIFPQESLTEQQQPWLELLNKGTYPYRPPHERPGAFVSDKRWLSMLKDSIEAGRSDHWLAWLHLGVIHFAQKNNEAAKQAWQISLDREPSAWAYRNLAQLELLSNDASGKAADLYIATVELFDDLPQLTAEAVDCLIKTDRWNDLENILAAAPQNVSSHSRIQLAYARLQLHQRKHEQAARTLAAIELHDLREAESTLTDLWVDIHTAMLKEQGKSSNKTAILKQYPLPENIDFRMTDD